MVNNWNWNWNWNLPFSFSFIFKFLLIFFLYSGSQPLAWGLPKAGFQNLEGLDLTTSSPAKKKELVFFWATWCGSCAQKLTKDLVELNALEDVSVITINIDSDSQRARHFVQKRQIQLPVWREKNKFWQTTLKVDSVPHWALFERPMDSSEQWKLIHSERAFDLEKIKQLISLKKTL